jgi:hypothetical protein
VQIDDQSSVHNFHLKDLTNAPNPHLDYKTGTGCQGQFFWNVSFEATSTINTDYEFKSDADPDNLREIVTSHLYPPDGDPPPPPGPPPAECPDGGPPPPAPPAPPPPPMPDFQMIVGPGSSIGVYTNDGRRVTRIPPGTYSIQVHDFTTVHDFHLKGPGVDEKTGVEEIEHPIWNLTFSVGTYTFHCDVHPSIKGTLTVAVGAPPPVLCHVPKVVGKLYATARRKIKQGHCKVGKVRRAHSTRARNKVVRQSPKAGRKLARGSPVNLVVSSGRG